MIFARNPNVSSRQKNLDSYLLGEHRLRAVLFRPDPQGAERADDSEDARDDEHVIVSRDLRLEDDERAPDREISLGR